jgi:signal transduction histidine kinase
VTYGGDSGTQPIVIDFSIRPVLDRSGETRFLVVEGRDVTEQRRLERAVEEQRQELMERTAQLAQTQERIARELKDTVIKSVFGATITLGATAKLAARPEVRERIISAVKELDSAIQQIKNAVFDLRNPHGPAT